MSVKIGSDGLNERTSRDYIKKKKLTPPTNQGKTAEDTTDTNADVAKQREFLTARDLRRKQSRERRAKINKLLKEHKEKQEPQEPEE